MDTPFIKHPLIVPVLSAMSVLGASWIKDRSDKATVEVRLATLEKRADQAVSKDRFEEFSQGVFRELARIQAKLDTRR
jgi:hypothetical protein